MSATDVNMSDCSIIISEEEGQESEYETDLEIDDEYREEFDPSGKVSYLKECDELGMFTELFLFSCTCCRTVFISWFKYII